MFSDINLNDDLNLNDLDQILKKIYQSNFFDNVNVSLNNNILSIEVDEKPIIETTFKNTKFHILALIAWTVSSVRPTIAKGLNMFSSYRGVVEDIAALEADPKAVTGARLQNTGAGMLLGNRFVGEEEES